MGREDGALEVATRVQLRRSVLCSIQVVRLSESKVRVGRLLRMEVPTKG